MAARWNSVRKSEDPRNESGKHCFYCFVFIVLYWLSTQDSPETGDTRVTAHLSGSSLPHNAWKGEWTATCKRERFDTYHCPSRPSVVGEHIYLHAILNKFQQQRKEGWLSLSFIVRHPFSGLFDPQRTGHVWSSNWQDTNSQNQSHKVASSRRYSIIRENIMTDVSKKGPGNQDSRKQFIWKVSRKNNWFEMFQDVLECFKAHIHIRTGARGKWNTIFVFQWFAPIDWAGPAPWLLQNAIEKYTNWKYAKCNKVCWNVLKCSEVFWRCYELFGNVLKCLEMFWNVLKCSELFGKNQNCSYRTY